MMEKLSKEELKERDRLDELSRPKRIMEDFDMTFKQEYTQECPTCNMDMTVITQKDNNPEYYTDVWVVCSCGEKIYFDLPVN